MTDEVEVVGREGRLLHRPSLRALKGGEAISPEFTIRLIKGNLQYCTNNSYLLWETPQKVGEVPQEGACFVGLRPTHKEGCDSEVWD